MTLCGWKGNRRSGCGITLLVRYRFRWQKYLRPTGRQVPYPFASCSVTPVWDDDTIYLFHLTLTCVYLCSCSSSCRDVIWLERSVVRRHTGTGTVLHLDRDSTIHNLLRHRCRARDSTVRCILIYREVVCRKVPVCLSVCQSSNAACTVLYSWLERASATTKAYVYGRRSCRWEYAMIIGRQHHKDVQRHAVLSGKFKKWET